MVTCNVAAFIAYGYYACDADSSVLLVFLNVKVWQ